MMLKEFGQDLKFLRESKNITIAEISAQTRINPKFFTNIESGIFDFQPDTYIRAFLKEYARCINESEEHVLNEYIKAKSGFYSPKRKLEEKLQINKKPAEIVEDTAASEKKLGTSNLKSNYVQLASNQDKTDQKTIEPERSEEFSNKTVTQKVLLVIVIIVGIVSIFYLYQTLNNTDKRSVDVKPKSFSEISEDYENKIKGKNIDSSSLQKDSAQSITLDSLKLTIKAFKEVRVKIYIDEKRIVEEVIQPKDSLIVRAKQQFRFSASANSSIDLFLNGKQLKKPSTLSNSTIKNLIINKQGISSE